MVHKVTKNRGKPITARVREESATRNIWTYMIKTFEDGGKDTQPGTDDGDRPNNVNEIKRSKLGVHEN